MSSLPGCYLRPRGVFENDGNYGGSLGQKSFFLRRTLLQNENDVEFFIFCAVN